MTKDEDKEILIRYRMEQAHTALKEAELLLARSSTTLGAVNRAYYAMFYALLALLQQIGRVPRKHSGAIALFDSEFVKKGIFPKVLSAYLHQAFFLRQDSDYHAIEPVSVKDTKGIIRNASDFVQRIEDYLKGATVGLKNQNSQ